MPLLEVSAAGKRFDDGGAARWVLRDVSCSVAQGRTTAVVGPSGCGKSTLLSLMAGVLVPDAGSIRFHESDGRVFSVSSASERRRVRFRRQRIGFIFQFFNLVPTLTAAENVLLPLELNGLMASKDAALARLEMLGVAHCGHRFPSTLSGGEQQRVAIARALAHAPQLVLADEPTGNLDRGNAESVADLLWRAVREVGCALVVASHSERIASRADALVELGPDR